jgi:catechol 2,3-dioxygenase-like lactoylglutathione lyase family enzyme
MSTNLRYVHTSLVARDWKRLARFYEEVLGCTPVPPERNMSGSWLEAATGVPGARIQGVHLRLPGCGEGGPTLEIFQYSPEADRHPGAANRPGYGHIAFIVDDVPTAREAVLAAGGSCVGETVTAEIQGSGTITFVYLADPEGNVVELQQWSR